MALSDSILGRVRSRKAFSEGKPFRVGCYMHKTISGRSWPRYADPSKLRGKGRGAVIYRVRVIPKPGFSVAP